MPCSDCRGSLKLKISVIIPTFNRAETLLRALQSVVKQTFSPHEIIVIDDGSTDATQSLVESHFPDITLLSQPNHGVSHARNQGIKSASGDWIALLDSDDEWKSNKLELQKKALTNRTGIRICHTEEIWVRNGRRVNAMNKHKKYDGEIFEHCLPLCAMSPSSILIEKSVFEEFGCFDESLVACEDYDLWLRLTSQMNVCFIAEPLLIKYGGHQDQLSAKHWGMDRFRLFALEKLLSTTPLTKDQHEIARLMLINKLDVILAGAKKRGKKSYAADYENRYGRFRKHPIA